jgi:type II secretory pathway component PulF
MRNVKTIMQPRDKARLFHDLGELIRSGVPFHKAIELLSQRARGPVAGVMRGLRTSLANGDTLPEALSKQRGINDLDAALFSASERSGKLDRGFALAAEYYKALDDARSKMWTRAAYPIFILHFGLIAFNVPMIIKDGFPAFARALVTGMIVIWAAAAAAYIVGSFATDAARHSATIDRILRAIPLIGGLRRAFAMSRFCAAYDMQLEAGVNVYETLDAAGRASASAITANAAARARDEVRSGSSVGAGLERAGDFPEPVTRVFFVGEETGRLDEELRALAAEYRASAMRRLDALAEWAPRALYVGILIFVAYRIVSFYLGYFGQMKDLIER